MLVLVSLLALVPGNIFAFLPFSWASRDSLPAIPVLQQTATATPEPVQSPKDGEALQGVVSVLGTTDFPGLRSVEVSFAYQKDSTGTWFLIQQNNQPVMDGPLATWDTTTITDGVYRLRVQIFFQDGQIQERIINGLRVRNYTPVETSTPDTGHVAARVETPTPTASPLPDFQVTPRVATPAPTNPVQLTGESLQSSALRGVLAILGALMIAGIYVGLRVLSRR